MKTRIYKDHRKGWSATTTEMISDTHRLTIKTAKNYGKQIETVAQVDRKDGSAFVHSFTMFQPDNPDNDFSLSLGTVAGRATKKKITEIHQGWVTRSLTHDVREQALRHYELLQEEAKKFEPFSFETNWSL